VDWHKNERKESFAVFARSFSKRISEFEGRPVHCFDLRDLERVLSPGKRDRRTAAPGRSRRLPEP